jgi:RNA polymerase sigma factor (sigma-70 family)
MREQSIVHNLAPAEVVPLDERLAALFDTHYPRLYRLARRLVPTVDDALDLVQETFVRVARASKPVPSGAAAEEAWLVRVLINIRRDEWRKASVRNRTIPGSTPQGRSPEASWVARTAVWQALDRLPPRRRAIVVMHELEDIDVPEIASLLGISAITVRWHLSVGRRELSLVLKSYLGGDQ